MKNDILTILQSIFAEVFEDLESPITEATTAKDVEEWDSITHVELIVAVEKAFDVRLKSSEIAECTEVGKIIEVIGRHSG